MILDLHQQGLTVSAISRETGMAMSRCLINGRKVACR
ncbi:hypothetical protein ACVIKP_004952 [Rhizobium leguminosarum]